MSEHKHKHKHTCSHVNSLIGKKVESFKANAYQDGKFIEVSNKDIENKWSVFFFYPADFTFVCPTELQDLSEVYDEFKKLNCEVYAVSTDSHFVHKAWADATPTIGNIKYPMIGDTTGKITRQFGIMIEETGQALRGTFIVDPTGTIKAYEVHSLGIGRNAEELLRKLQAAQFVHENGDQVCPARWKPGSDTLKPSIELVGKI